MTSLPQEVPATQKAQGFLYNSSFKNKCISHTEKLFSFGFLQVESAVDVTHKDKPTRPCAAETSLKVAVTMMGFFCTVRLYNIAENFIHHLAEITF